MKPLNLTFHYSLMNIEIGRLIDTKLEQFPGEFLHGY